jgi:hypothetical protein
VCDAIDDVRACASGACPGEQRCVPAGEFAKWTECAEGVPSEETCNGLDDDCDGAIDEGFGETTCGVGACEVVVSSCVECVPGAPGAETCNAVDDDCDGVVDEGFGPATCGVGACEVTVETCVDGIQATCVPGAPSAEVCTSAVDEDCDGQADCDDSDCASDAACDCVCRSGSRCLAEGAVICFPAPDYPCSSADGWYAVCGRRGWECMFTTPAVC